METWKPNLEDEAEPRANLNIGSGEFLAHRGNTRLYTFLGHLAMYDHVFCHGEESGFFIFNIVDGYETLKEFIIQNNFPMYLNQTEVSQVDLDAYDRTIQAIASKIEGVPEEWL